MRARCVRAHAYVSLCAHARACVVRACGWLGVQVAGSGGGTCKRAAAYGGRGRLDAEQRAGRENGGEAKADRDRETERQSDRDSETVTYGTRFDSLPVHGRLFVGWQRNFLREHTLYKALRILNEFDDEENSKLVDISTWRRSNRQASLALAAGWSHP